MNFTKFQIRFIRNTNRLRRRIKKYFGITRPKLRGFMLNPLVKEQDLLDAIALGANLFRFQIFFENFDKLEHTVFPRINMCIEICKKHNAKLILDLHNTPGGVTLINDRPHSVLFHNPLDEQTFYSVWHKIVSTYKDEKTVWAYDIFNEPAFWGKTTNGASNLKRLYANTVGMIRQLDKKTIIILQPPFGDPSKIAGAKIKQRKRIWYSCHMYHKMAITHQNIPGRKYNKAISYPTSNFGKKELEDYLNKVVKFEEENDVNIYIGEFSCIRWAPNNTSNNYILDCIEKFEKEKWIWTYHAWREWVGWNAENSEVTLAIFKTFFKNNK